MPNLGTGRLEVVNKQVLQQLQRGHRGERHLVAFARRDAIGRALGQQLLTAGALAKPLRCRASRPSSRCTKVSAPAEKLDEIDARYGCSRTSTSRRRVASHSPIVN
jgi:hypothetical protein